MDNGRRVVVRFPAEATHSSLLQSDRTDIGPRTVSCQVGHVGYPPGGKAVAA